MAWNDRLSLLKLSIRPTKTSHFPWAEQLKIIKNQQSFKLQKWSQTYRDVMEHISIYVRGRKSTEKIPKFLYGEELQKQS